MNIIELSPTMWAVMDDEHEASLAASVAARYYGEKPDTEG